MLSIQWYKLKTYIVVLMISLSLWADPMNITVGLNKSNDGDVLGYRIYFYSYFIDAGITYAEYFDKKTEDLHTFNQGSFAKTEIKDNPEFYTVQEISEEICGKLLFVLPDHSKMKNYRQPQNVDPAKNAPFKEDKPVIVAFTLDENIYKTYKSMKNKPFKLINGNHASRLKSKLYSITNLFTNSKYISVVGKSGVCFILTIKFPLNAINLKSAETLFEKKLSNIQNLASKGYLYDSQKEELVNTINETNYYSEIETVINELKPYFENYSKLSNNYDFAKTDEYDNLQEIEDKIFVQYKLLNDQLLDNKKKTKNVDSQTEKTLTENFYGTMKNDINYFVKSVQQKEQYELGKKYINEFVNKKFAYNNGHSLRDEIESFNLNALKSYAKLASLFIEYSPKESRTREAAYIDVSLNILEKLGKYLVRHNLNDNIETQIDTPGDPEYEPKSEFMISKKNVFSNDEMNEQPQSEKGGLRF